MRKTGAVRLLVPIFALVGAVAAVLARTRWTGSSGPVNFGFVAHARWPYDVPPDQQGYLADTYLRIAARPLVDTLLVAALGALVAVALVLLARAVPAADRQTSQPDVFDP